MCKQDDDFAKVQEIHKDLNDLITKIMAAEKEVHSLGVKNNLVELRDTLDAAKYDNIENGASYILESVEQDRAPYRHELYHQPRVL